MKNRPHNANDLTGQTFGNLLAISVFGTDPKYKILLWRFRCLLCNGEYIGSGIDVKRGKVKSCGCKKNSKNSNGMWKGYNDIYGTTYNHYKSSAKKRNKEFNISIEYLWEKYIDQNKKCPYTGIELLLSTNKEKYKNGIVKRTTFNASLDRIDSNLGYIEGNVQWVYKDINFMKGEMSHQEFVEMCKMVTEHTIHAK